MIPYSPKERKVGGHRGAFLGHEGAQGAVSRPTHGIERIRPHADPPEAAQFGKGPRKISLTAHPYEHYDYPGGLSDPEEAQQEAEMRTQVGGVEHTLIEVEGNTMGLGVGNLVSLRKSRKTSTRSSRSGTKRISASSI